MDVQSTAMNFMASPGSDVESHISIPAGIIVGLLASFIQSLGLTIQRKSHVQNQALPEEQRKVEHRRPLWLLGFGIFISSNLFGSVFQIASLPVVILAPLGAVSLLWNAFFARILLGDAFSIWMLLGTLFIAGGAVLIAVFGIVPEPNHSLEDLLVLFSRPAFIAYFSLLGIFTVVCLAVTHIVEFSYTRRNRIELIASPPLSPLVAPTTAPTILTTAATPSSAFDPTQITTERTPLIDRKPSTSRSPSPSPSSLFSPYTTSTRTPLFLAMSYASFSGIISGMCLLFAKSGVELLVLTIGGKNQFWRWQAWVLVIGLVICALLQLWYMHKSLVLANPTLICPLAFCLYNLSSIVNGLVYFDQFSLLSTKHLLLVTLGITVLLAGVWIVSFPPSGGISIDLASWWEEPEPHVELAEHEEVIHEPFEDEPLPMITQRHSGSRQDEVLLSPDGDNEEGHGIGLGIVPIPEESRGRKPRDYASLRINPQAPPKVTSHIHHRGQTDSVVSAFPATSPPHSATEASSRITRLPRQRATSALTPSISNSSTQHSLSHSHTYTTPRHSQSLFPYPLSPGAPSGTVTGFSIGLSPMSPGFALVNRDSRRSNSGRARKRVSSNGKITAPGGMREF
ncbi:hypothetical protein QCA50_001854 [Cerrena zonata]|uniref:Magnesium transporter n=1 Tax=Cerrena zonata TaxID=2478898 RepID=A0AAW0GXZ7_9APHY